MTIALVSLCTPEMDAVGRLSEPNRRAYCRRHGYELVIGRRRLNASRPPAWSKLPLVLENLGRFDWIFFSDADSLLLRSELPLSFLTDDPAFAGADLLVTRDRHGVNSGQFLISNRSGRARPFIEAVLSQSQFIPHRLGDQAAFTHAIDTNLAPIVVREVAKPLLNAEVYDVTRESFVLHFLGQPARVYLLRKWLRERGELPPAGGSSQRKPKLASAGAAKAAAALQAGRADDAIALCREALEADAADGAAMHVLGLACREAGANDEGFDWLCRSVELAPDVADFHNNLGSALAECGAPDDAAEHFRRALALRPTFALAAQNLGRASSQTQKGHPRAVGRRDGRPAEAEKEISSG